VTELAFPIPEELVEAIAERAAELVVERLRDQQAAQDGPRWLYGAKAAAEYLGWPVGRVEKLTAATVLPCRRIGQRCSYRTDELAAFPEDHYEGPPRLRSVR
jgi:hypothetical protein